MFSQNSTAIIEATHWCRRTKVVGLIAALTVSLLSLVALASNPQDFEGVMLVDIALEAGIQDRHVRMRGAAPADYDGDGDIDIFLSSTGDQSRVFWNETDAVSGAIRFVTGEVLVDGDPAYVASVADYDNDGDPDIFVGVGGVDSVGFDYLFQNNTGVFEDVTEAAGVAGPLSDGSTIPTATGGGAWADYDNDGWLDLYVTTHIVDSTLRALRGRNTLYRNRGDGTFEDVTVAAGVGDEGSGWAPSWFDFDNDGWMDLYVANRGGDNALYHNEGNGSFTEVTTELLKEPRLSWGSLTEDFNNDGWMDLFVIGRRAREHGLFINDGTGGFTNEALSAGLNIPGDESTFANWMGFQAGDFTNDGYVELYLGAGGPRSGTLDHFFLNCSANGPLRFEIITPTVDYPAPSDGGQDFPTYPYRTHGTAFVDFDDDGDLDLLVGNGGPRDSPDTREPNRLFRNDMGSLNNWVDLHLVGTTSNRDGIGARIAVRSQSADGTINSRYTMVKGFSGFGSNNAIDPHIGIGHDLVIVDIMIRWPSGILQQLDGPDLNSRLTVQEPDTGPIVTVNEFRAPDLTLGHFAAAP